MTQTPYERLKAARLRKKRGLVAVTITSKKLTIDIPENRVDDLIAWAKEAMKE